MIRFFCPGCPAPGGSKKSFRSHSTGRIVTLDDAKRNASWRAVVALAGRQAYQGEPLTFPLGVRVTFWMPRPKSHYDAKGRIKPSAASHHSTRPDASKLWRAAEDALTGVLWHDDGLIAVQNIEKRYVVGQGCPGMEIEVYPLLAVDEERLRVALGKDAECVKESTDE